MKLVATADTHYPFDASMIPDVAMCDSMYNQSNKPMVIEV